MKFLVSVFLSILAVAGNAEVKNITTIKPTTAQKPTDTKQMPCISKTGHSAATHHSFEILPDLPQVLAIIKKTRRLKAELPETQQYNVLSILLKAINPQLAIVSPKQAKEYLKKSKYQKKINQKVFQPVKLNKKIIYCRFNSFPDKAVKEFSTILNTPENAPIGLIIDLRQCHGYDYINMQKVLLSCLDNIPSWLSLSVKSKHHALKSFIMILVSQHTSGTAEIFAAAAKHNSRCMLLGAKTSGTPFKQQIHHLKSGALLLTPQIPPVINKLPPCPATPQLPINPYPQANYKEISKSNISSKDKCLQAAIDLIISLSLLR
jgi:hypothetical protein